MTARRAVVFTVLAYAWSWSCWLPLIATGSTVTAGVGWPTHLPGLAGPAVAAVLTTYLFDGGPGLVALGRRVVRWRLPLRVWLVVPGTAAVAVACAVLAPGASPSTAAWARYTGAPAGGLVEVVVLVLVVNGLGEETGWRGFLADALLPRLGLRGTSLAVAVVWGLWHLPLFFCVDTFEDLGVLTAGWAVGLLAGSVVLTALYAGGRGSVLLVAMWHTVYNLGSATDAARGLPAAVTSTLVMVAAVVLLVRSGPVRRGQGPYPRGAGSARLETAPQRGRTGGRGT